MSWSRASFASWSTISFPSMPQWLGTQQKRTWVPLSLNSQRRSQLAYFAWLFQVLCLVDLVVLHYCDVVMSAIASQITSLTSVYSIVYSGADQRKHESSASLAFVRGIHRWPVNSPHKGPVTRKMVPFDDVTMSGHGLTTCILYAVPSLANLF